jgi:hypothetical protein
MITDFSFGLQLYQNIYEYKCFEDKKSAKHNIRTLSVEQATVSAMILQSPLNFELLTTPQNIKHVPTGIH